MPIFSLTNFFSVNSRDSCAETLTASSASESPLCRNQPSSEALQREDVYLSLPWSLGSRSPPHSPWASSLSLLLPSPMHLQPLEHVSHCLTCGPSPSLARTLALGPQCSLHFRFSCHVLSLAFLREIHGLPCHCSVTSLMLQLCFPHPPWPPTPRAIPLGQSSHSVLASSQRSLQASSL